VVRILELPVDCCMYGILHSMSLVWPTVGEKLVEQGLDVAWMGVAFFWMWTMNEHLDFLGSFPQTVVLYALSSYSKVDHEIRTPG